MNALKYLVSKEFLFYINPLRFETADKVFFAIAALALVLTVVLFLSVRFGKNPVVVAYLRKFLHLSFTFALLAVLWSGLRYERVRWFGTHFSFIVLLVGAGVWKSKIVWHMLKHLKADLATHEKMQQKDKYLKMSAK